MNDAAVNVALKFVDQATAPMKNALGHIERQTKSSALSLNRIIQGINKAYYTLLAFGAVSSLAMPFEKGIEAADEFRLTTIGIAATLTDMAKKSDRSLKLIYDQNLRYAEETYQKVELAAAKWFASGEEMVSAWKILTNKGTMITSEQDIDNLGVIVDRIKLSTQGQMASLQIAQELRAVMNGQARATDQIAMMLKDRLGPAWENQLKQAREEGRVLEWLASQFQGLRVASDDISKTLESQKSTLGTLLKQVGRQGLAGAYDDIVEGVSKINDYLRENRDAISSKIAEIWRDIKGVVTDPALTKFFGSILSSGAESIKGMVQPLKDIYRSLQQIVGIYNSLPAEVTGPMGTGIIFRLLTGSSTVGMLATLNQLLDKSNMSLQGMLRTSKEISQHVGDVWGAATGKRDASTGEWNLPPGSVKKPIPFFPTDDKGRPIIDITPMASPAPIIAPAIDQDTKSMKAATKAAEELKRALQKLEETRAKAITTAHEDVYGKFQEGSMDAGIRTGGVFNAQAEARFERHNDILQEGLDLYREMRTPLEQYNAEMEKLVYLLQYGAINQDTFNRASEGLKQTLASSDPVLRKINDQIDAAGSSLSTAIIDTMNGSQGSIEQFFNSILQGLQRMIVELMIVGPMMEALKGSMSNGYTSGGGGFWGTVGNFFSGLFGGGGKTFTSTGGASWSAGQNFLEHAKGDYWFTEPTAAVGLRTGKRHLIAEAGQAEYLAGPNPRGGERSPNVSVNVTINEGSSGAKAKVSEGRMEYDHVMKRWVKGMVIDLITNDPDARGQMRQGLP